MWPLCPMRPGAFRGGAAAPQGQEPVVPAWHCLALAHLLLGSPRSWLCLLSCRKCCIAHLSVPSVPSALAWAQIFLPRCFVLTARKLWFRHSRVARPVTQTGPRSMQPKIASAWPLSQLPYHSAAWNPICWPPSLPHALSQGQLALPMKYLDSRI